MHRGFKQVKFLQRLTEQAEHPTRKLFAFRHGEQGKEVLTGNHVGTRASTATLGRHGLLDDTGLRRYFVWRSAAGEVAV